MLLLTFQQEDADIANEVQSSILRHMWYLRELLVALVLFDDEVMKSKESWQLIFRQLGGLVYFAQVNQAFQHDVS